MLFLYLYSPYLTRGKDARNQRKSERAFRTSAGEMRPPVSGDSTPER
jgi:hypothetical protein